MMWKPFNDWVDCYEETKKGYLELTYFFEYKEYHMTILINDSEMIINNSATFYHLGMPKNWIAA